MGRVPRPFFVQPVVPLLVTSLVPFLVPSLRGNGTGGDTAGPVIAMVSAAANIRAGSGRSALSRHGVAVAAGGRATWGWDRWGRWRRRYPFGRPADRAYTQPSTYDEPAEPPYEEPPMPPPVVMAAPPPPPPMAEPPAEPPMAEPNATTPPTPPAQGQAQSEEFFIEPEAFEFEPELDEYENGWGEFEGDFEQYETSLDELERGQSSQPAECPPYQRGEVDSPEPPKGICHPTSSGPPTAAC